MKNGYHKNGNGIASHKDYELLKVAPQAKDFEEVVLGALLIDKTAFAAVADILSAKSFYDPRHAIIFETMLGMQNRLLPIDLLTVSEELRKAGHDKDVSVDFLIELTNRVASGANVEHHARIIEQKAMQRELIALGYKLVKDGYDASKDVFDLLDESERGLFGIFSKESTGQARHISLIVREVVRKVSRMKGVGNKLLGIPSGFRKLDELTGGWQAPNLIILAARPGMGKTALALALARNAAQFGKAVALFSLEMSSDQLTTRLLSMQCGVPTGKIRRHKFTDTGEELAFSSAANEAEELPIYIDDTASISILQLRTRARQLKIRHDIKMLIVDYLQLMDGATASNRNREQEISSISRGLKAIAKELKIPVVALSQLSRAVEIRGGAKRPQLSDLRESGAIEQDADIVTFLYRPEYYEIFKDAEGQSLKGLAELIVAKHRDGALDTIKLVFNSRSTTFSDPEDDFFAPMDDDTPF